MWTDEVDEVLAGDQVLALAHVTPARGVVMTPVTNFTLRDREAGTISAVNSSAALWSKLERIRAEPRVALAYHTRTHGLSSRPEYVLVQGRATLADENTNYHREHAEEWERATGPADYGPLTRWWLRHYLRRVEITVAVERIVVWPDLRCSGEPEVHGAPLPAEPPAPQSPPKGGTGPRIDHERGAKRAARLPEVLLGWVGADGFPVVAPVSTGAPVDAGIPITSNLALPPGGRRAGLIAHSFARHAVGQEQRIHTGWLEDGVYAPHTERGHRLPRSYLLFKFGSGFETRRRARSAPTHP